MIVNLFNIEINVESDIEAVKDIIYEYFQYGYSERLAQVKYNLVVCNIREFKAFKMLDSRKYSGKVFQKEGYIYDLFLSGNKKILISKYGKVNNIISISGNTIKCYIDESFHDGRMVFIRVIREVLLREFENMGGVLIHASAVNIGGTSSIFIGNSGSGKSTIAQHLCCKGGADFISNDKCLIDKGMNVYTYPMALRLSVPPLKAMFNSVEEIRVRDDTPKDIFVNPSYIIWNSPKKAILTVKEFCRITKSKHSETAKIGNLVLPMITNIPNTFSIEALNESHVRVIKKKYFKW